jgi:hypothetical protein
MPSVAPLSTACTCCSPALLPGRADRSLRASRPARELSAARGQARWASRPLTPPRRAASRALPGSSTSFRPFVHPVRASATGTRDGCGPPRPAGLLVRSCRPPRHSGLLAVISVMEGRGEVASSHPLREGAEGVFDRPPAHAHRARHAVETRLRRFDDLFMLPPLGQGLCARRLSLIGSKSIPPSLPT